MKSTTRTTEATAEIFWIAFQVLPKAEQHAVVCRFASDNEFREDLVDLAVFQKRRREASRPFRDYLKDRAKERSGIPFMSGAVRRKSWNVLQKSRMHV